MAIRNESDLERATRELQSLCEAAKDTPDGRQSMELNAEISKKTGAGQHGKARPWTSCASKGESKP